MFDYIFNALICGWVLSIFKIDDFVVEFMQTGMNIPQATVAYYYVLCIVLGVIGYCFK